MLTEDQIENWLEHVKKKALTCAPGGPGQAECDDKIAKHECLGFCGEAIMLAQVLIGNPPIPPEVLNKKRVQQATLDEPEPVDDLLHYVCKCGMDYGPSVSGVSGCVCGNRSWTRARVTQEWHDYRAKVLAENPLMIAMRPDGKW